MTNLKRYPSSIVLDPLPYLVVSNAIRRWVLSYNLCSISQFVANKFYDRKDLAKPYDPKKAVWTPDGNGGFTEGIIQVRISFYEVIIFVFM